MAIGSDLERKKLKKGALILGGAASGKSEWAENLAESLSSSITYLATGQAFDEETKKRVKIHQSRRDARWKTVEEPLDPGRVLTELSASDVVLIDCATMWLTNLMMADRNVDEAPETLCQGLASCKARWIIVSNEVGQGIVPQNALARSFRNAQGRLNIALAKQADTVVQVIAGLPQVLKGQLP